MNPKRVARVVVPILVIGVVIWIAVRLITGDGSFTASGTVEATEADLGFERAGRIDSIAVREGDLIKAGDLVARLDQRELRARLRAAEAHVAATRARLNELQRGFRSEEIAQARAAARAAQQRRDNARRDLERTRQLFEGGAVSREALDHHETAFELADAEYTQAIEAQNLFESGARPEQIDAQRAALHEAEANVALIEANLANTVITAPFSGRVTNRHRELGEIVSPGSPVVSIMNPDDRWVRIYVREDTVGRLSIGQRVTISADSYEDRRYGGEITFIADEAEFTPSNVQTTEERVKLVYEVRVRIVEDPTFDLKPGLAADIRLESSSERGD